jgi:hypothetical protein
MIIPIVMIGMVGPKNTIPEGLENSPLDGYLTKSCNAEDVLNLIKKLIATTFIEN